MSSNSAKPVGENTPALPLFSYAQAAKGRSVAPTASAVQPHSATVPTTIKDTNSIVVTPSQGSERGGVSTTGSDELTTNPEAWADDETRELKTPISEQEDSVPSSSGPVPPAARSCKDETRDDDPVLVKNTPEIARDRNLPGRNPSQRLSGTTDDLQGKKGKKPKGTVEPEIEKEEIKSEVLVPAPLPAVNFWLQRKERLAMTTPSPVSAQNSKISADSSGPAEKSVAFHAKPADSKKRHKHQLGIEKGERYVGGNQNAGSRDTPVSNRFPRKGGESTSRIKEDHAGKRNGPRGSRLGDKDERSTGSRAPPPVEDSVSWPTPETVLEEDKRKVQGKQDRDEKDENSSNKPRPKERWVPVPYIPTVTFNTPMPTRGGRGRGGTRAARGEPVARPNINQNIAAPGDKLPAANLNNSKSSAEAERLDVKENPSTTSLPSGRRQLGDHASTRKSSNMHSTEKSRPGQPKSEPYSFNDHPNAPGPAHSDQNPEYTHDSLSRRGESANAFRPEQGQTGDLPKSVTSDCRSESHMRNFDYLKDSNPSKEISHQTRERSDGRPERGRGVFRGRGGHSNYPNGQSHQSNFANGNSTQQQNGYGVRQSTDPYSPPLAPLLNTQFSPLIRGGRGGPRSQSIPTSGMFGCFSQSSGSISQQFASLQASTPMFDYVPMQPMSATPYQPYIDHVSVLAMVTMQLEYYFSIDNLCKDIFLRRHMDSQGYVFLSFIAGFKRIQALTQDFELLRFACQESEAIELIRGDDGIDRLRRREGWEKWVLNMEERDESTRNPGPSFWHRPQRAQKPQYFGQMVMTSPDSLVSYSATEPSFRPYDKVGPIVPSLNGTEIYHPETPLSAAVPDFAPGILSAESNISSLDAETTFHDEEVANLTLVFASPSGNMPPQAPFHNSPRTFSNGSIDRKSITEELYKDLRSSYPATYGSRDTSPENQKRSLNPLSPLSPPRSDASNGPPVMWVKGKKQQVPVSERNSQELYIVFRARALKNREISSSESTDIHPDMKLLYEFWSHFLCRNFNSRMYSEFRQYALEDAQTGSLNGMKNLISYYDEILNSKKKTIPEVLAQHFVDLVKLETSDERPALERLRAAWRNGALDLKSRKKIDNLVDSKLREELERAPSQKVDFP